MSYNTIEVLQDETKALRHDVLLHLEIVGEEMSRENYLSEALYPFDADYWWDLTPEALRSQSQSLIRRLVGLAGRIAKPVKSSALTSEADTRELGKVVKAIRGALRLRHYVQWDSSLLTDEDRVVGVQNEGQSEDRALSPKRAADVAKDGFSRIIDLLDLVMADSDSVEVSESQGNSTVSRVKTGTAFIMMWMDPTEPGLEDVHETVKQVFASFGIRAVRADDIEHEDKITDRIVNEIKTAEFLFADLSGTRPNVYYEVGFAHALGKRVILYRRSGTSVHFDLANYNCPEYKNITELRSLLEKRLIGATNRSPKKHGD